MSYQRVRQQIHKKQLASVYLLYGTESYFIQELQKEIIKLALPDHDTEAISDYDLKDTPIQDVIADAETYPLFSDRKIIIARNPVFLKAKLPKLSFEHDVDALEQYINNPVPFTVMVFIAPYEKIDERKKISKVMKNKATVTVALCQPLRERDTARWINEYVNDLGISLHPEVAEMLEAEFAGNLDILKNELHKYSLYVGERGHVTSEIAEQLTTNSINHSGLRLADAVMEKDLHQAITVSKELLKMNEEPIALIGLLAFQFRSVLRVKLLKQAGYTEPQIMQHMKAHPYVVKIAIKREKKFTKRQLEQIMSILTNADEAMKQGKMEKDLALELLLYDLIEPAA